jgi:hypothetical protein
MAIQTEYSRLVWKRSTVVGVEPTIPTATTIDNTWLDTDILIGEGFINVADDKFWFRTNNGITEINLSGVSSNNYYTNLAYMSAGTNTLYFDRTDLAEAYAVDLSQFATGGTGGDAVWSSGDTGSYSMQANNTTAYAAGNYAVVGGTSSGSSEHVVVFGSLNNVSGSTTFAHGDALSSGAQYGTLFGGNHSTLGNYTFAQGFNHEIQGTTNHSAILGGTLSVVESGVDRSVILGGSGLSATTDDTVYVDYLNINTLPTGTAVYNLGLDANGDVIQGGGATISGDTIVGEFSATTVSILNSGATTREYFDYSSNTVESGVTNSAIVAGSGNTITSGLRNVFVSGVDLSATTNDTAYFSNIDLNGESVVVLNADEDYVKINDGLSIILTGVPWSDSFAISDETTAITTGTEKLTWFAPYAMTITDVYASLSTSGSTSSQFDIGLNGTTILSTEITIDANEFHSSDAATPPVISNTAIAQFDKLTFDIDTAGTAAAGAKIYILGTITGF